MQFRGSACVSRPCRTANKVQRVMSFNAFWKFLRPEKKSCDFSRVNYFFGVQGIFRILLETLWIFFFWREGGWIFLPIRSCPSLEIWALEFVQLVVRFMHCNIYLKSFSTTTGNLGDLLCNLKGIHYWCIIINCHDEGSTSWVSINERKI